MKYSAPQFGQHTKKTMERFRRIREVRNQEFVKQQISLPSGATFTLCRGSSAAAEEHEDE